VDGAVTQLNGHTPAGVLRGGKSSLFEGGTRVPFIVSWPGKIKPGVSDALVGQIDLGASFASFFHQRVPSGSMTDAENTMDAFLGKARKGRTVLVEHSGTLAIVKDNWKYIAPSNRQPYFKATDTETGGSKEPQLYDLSTDIGERNNLAGKYPQKVAELAGLLSEIQQKK
jgi:arylsulfatase A-like enzyme